MTGVTNLDWKTYESITKYIYETLGRHAGVTVKGYGINCKVVGKSGLKHQIDVLTSHKDGSHTYETAIECKYWKQKVNKDVVMKLSSIMDDAGISKGIIITRSGFTKDGQDYAKFKNIGLVTLREWNENSQDFMPQELEIATLQIKLNIKSTRPKLLQIELGKNRFLDVQDEFDLFNYYIDLMDGQRIPFYDYVTDFRLMIASQKEMEVEITKRYKVPESRFYRRGILEVIKIEDIIITGKLTQSDESRNIEFRLVDKVWLIMKSIFEEKTFSFSESGIIAEHTK